MGALDDGQFVVELVDGVSVGMGFEPEILQIEEAVKVLLQGLGEDVNREGLRKTPARVAKALSEGTRGYRQKAKDIVQGALFPEVGLDDGVGHAGGVGGLVIVRDLDLFSYCESCLLPFQVKCHVGYVPSGQRVVGLSKLSRVADVFAKRLQDPQRLADEVCSALNHGIKPAGVAVVLQCLHMHFPSLELGYLDSNHQEWVKVSVCSGKGLFESTKAAIWSDFLNLLKFRGINVEKTRTRDSTSPWCPSQSSFASTPCKIEPVHQMVAAVTSILKSLGEDPSRKELVGSPDRYVRWLKNFERADLGLKLNGHVCDQMNPFQPNCSKEEMQSELNLSFWSLCEHHLLPFHGVVHIGYFCSKGTDPIARSTLESIVNFYGFKLQVQERLTRQVSETVSSLLGGGDVIVVVEASHSCMVSRGIEKLGSNTATMALLGGFSSDDAAKNMFLQSIQNISTS